MNNNKLIQIAIDTVFFAHSYSGITKVWEIILHNLYNLSNFISPDANSIYNIPRYEIILLIRGHTIPDSLKKIIKNNNSNNNSNDNSNNNSNDNSNDNSNVKITHLIINEFNYFTMCNDVDYLNYICKQNKFDYFISTYYTYCTIIPNILMIYDMIPEIFKLSINHQWIQKDLAIKNAFQFIVISKTTKNDLNIYYPHINLNKYNVSLIYTCVMQSTLQMQYDTNFYNNILIPSGIQSHKYIFSIASNNEKYKNADLIINLAKKYNSQLSQILSTKIPIILLIKQNLPNGYCIDNGILYISNIRNEIVNILYKNAMCYVCPSLYEGFGLPIFEAFSHNIPVIAIHQPIFVELANNAINFIENDIDDLFNKICYIHKNSNKSEHNINKCIANGLELLKLFSPHKQIQLIHNLLNSLEIHTNIPLNNIPLNNILQTLTLTLTPDTQSFLNIIFQSYDETNIERRKELEYCITANLDNPYILYIHDFGFQSYTYLPDVITKHPKYISVNTSQLLSDNKWITYDLAFNYSNNVNSQFLNKYGSYWGIINCDIFLDNNSNWKLIRGKLNSNYIFAQSRHEFNILQDDDIKVNDLHIDTNISKLNVSKLNVSIKMDDSFSKLYHSTTQDGWFYKSPVNHTSHSGNSNSNSNSNLGDISCISSVNFEMGFLGCDNAIADRLIKIGYKIINQPETFKILHYDIAKGKTSKNFLEKHLIEDTERAKKNINEQSKYPKNSHPERHGYYLVPNYDQLLGSNKNIDLISNINKLGGLSNLEMYKIISDLYSARILIHNPD